MRIENGLPESIHVITRFFAITNALTRADSFLPPTLPDSRRTNIPSFRLQEFMDYSQTEGASKNAK
ncbi:MAG: hypothetical protein H0X66_00900 [Verrucomicrobia bacterium]|nr:hypothetical protein [Verrucomicrobiota bacterium]